MQQELWQQAGEDKLSGGFPDKLVLLDCETTGGRPTWHRVTEIGLLTVDNGAISGQWQTLVNPGQVLSPMIQRLTGITPAMLANAPSFSDIADELWQYLEGRTLLAHNVRFDFGFLKQEFQRLERRYSPAQLCSARLSRQLFPQFKRHGLDAIIRRFDLHVEKRHRALDDAQAIWQFLLKTSALLEQDKIEQACRQISKRPSLPAALPAGITDDLPRGPGVYLFYDEAGNLLYVGKSVNIRDRVLSHFSADYNNPKDLKMNLQIAHIEARPTLSDFSAQLLESRLIKQLSPVHNRRLKKTVRLYRVVSRDDARGYRHLAVESVAADADADGDSGHGGLFRSRRQAQKNLEKLADDFFLCHRLVGLENWRENAKDPCFRFQLHKCMGACCQREPAASYNLRVDEAMQRFRLVSWPWPSAVMVEEPSAIDEQRAYHLVDQWQYLGRVHDHSDLQERGLAVATSAAASFISSTKQHDESDRAGFDLDTYHILLRFLTGREGRSAGLRIIPLQNAAAEYAED